MDLLEEKADQTFPKPDLAATEFFLHLAAGSRFFRDREFDKAIREWEEAAKMRPDGESALRLLGSVSYQGNLRDVPLLGLLYALSSNAKTGVAIIRRDQLHKEVFFKEGWICSARTNRFEERLGNFLVKRGVVSHSQLEHFALQASKKGVKLGRYLVENGVLQRRELYQLLDFQIKEILCDLFTWGEGEFYFVEKELAEDDVIASYTPLDIALYAARRALDLSTFRKIAPNNKVIFQIPPYIEAAKEKIMEELDANEKFIFSLIDGRRNIDQLIKFSGDDEAFAITIIHRLLLMGLIVKSRDIGTYEDAEYEEVSRVLKILFEIFGLAMGELQKEVGSMAEEILSRAKKKLRDGLDRIFQGISPDGDPTIDTNKVLKNISVHYPTPSSRLIFIEAFEGLLSGILNEIKGILGIPLTKKVISAIVKTREDVRRFYPDSPAKKKLLESLDRLVSLSP